MNVWLPFSRQKCGKNEDRVDLWLDIFHGSLSGLGLKLENNTT